MLWRLPPVPDAQHVAHGLEQREGVELASMSGSASPRVGGGQGPLSPGSPLDPPCPRALPAHPSPRHPAPVSRVNQEKLDLGSRRDVHTCYSNSAEGQREATSPTSFWGNRLQTARVQPWVFKSPHYFTTSVSVFEATSGKSWGTAQAGDTEILIRRGGVKKHQTGSGRKPTTPDQSSVEPAREGQWALFRKQDHMPGCPARQ